METLSVIQNISSEYSTLYSKYQFDKIITRQKNDFHEIDDLISNISKTMNNIPINNRKCFNYKSSNVYLSTRLQKFMLNNNDVFKQYTSEEIPFKALESILTHFYSYHKIKDTDNEIYNEIKLFTSLGRYERRAHVKIFIDKWTSKTKNIQINL
jgi:hypothetical protein